MASGDFNFLSASDFSLSQFARFNPLVIVLMQFMVIISLTKKSNFFLQPSQSLPVLLLLHCDP